MYYYVYQITNLINGKIYVGKHKSHKPPFENGYYGSGKLIKAAINKYGIDNFKKDVLYYCTTSEEMAVKEADVVTEDFVAQKDTYNMHKGGLGGFEHINKDPQKRKEVSALVSARNKELGLGGTKNWTETSLEKMKVHSWSNKIKNGWSPNNWAKKNSEEQDIIREKLSNSSTGENNSQFGTRFYLDPTNPTIKKRFRKGQHPAGWVWVEEYKEQRMKNSKRWYNDGTKNYYITLPNLLIEELRLVKGRIR